MLALAHRPELVILDDPALGLDPIMRKQFNRDLIMHLQGEGRTVFYSSHLLYEVEPVADEIAILDQGRIVRQSGTEALRGDVKQIVLSREAAFAVGETACVLQRRKKGSELALVVDGAQDLIDELAARRRRTSRGGLEPRRNLRSVRNRIEELRTSPDSRDRAHRR